MKILKKIFGFILLLLVSALLTVPITACFNMATDKCKFVDTKSVYTYDELFDFDKAKTDINENMLFYSEWNESDYKTFDAKELFKDVKFTAVSPFRSELVMIFKGNGHREIGGTLDLSNYVRDNSVSNDEIGYLLESNCIQYATLFIFRGNAYLLAERGSKPYSENDNFSVEALNEIISDKRKDITLFRLDGFDIEFAEENFHTIDRKYYPWWERYISKWWYISVHLTGLYISLIDFVLYACVGRISSAVKRKNDKDKSPAPTAPLP